MPRDPNQAQQAAERKQAKREQKHPNLAQYHVPPGWVEKALAWPIHEVLLPRDWDNTNTLVTALVARGSFSDQIAAASFLVDLACLGVKDATLRLFKTQREYEERMRETVMSTQRMAPDSLDLVAKILDTAVEYAHRWGFEPHATYHQARWLLADALPERCSVHIPTGGPDGKPHFVAGPYDNVQQIMAKLTKTAGPGGFHYTVFTGSDPGFIDI